MNDFELRERLGLSVPYEWWPGAPLLKEIEAAGFNWVQIPSPPISVLTEPRDCARHAAAMAEALSTSQLAPMIHAPGSLQVGNPIGDRAMEGLLSYAADSGARLVVYHAANFPVTSAGEDQALAETHSLTALARRAEAVGVTIAIENLAPVFPGLETLSFTPRRLREMVLRIGSPLVGICLDAGHASLVASLRGADPAELIEPVLDHVVAFHLHDNLGSRRGGERRPELDPVRLDLHLPLGRGSIQWRELAPLFDRAPSAPLLLEIHPPRPAASELLAGALRALAAPQVHATADWS